MMIMMTPRRTSIDWSRARVRTGAPVAMRLVTASALIAPAGPRHAPPPPRTPPSAPLNPGPRRGARVLVRGNSYQHSPAQVVSEAEPIAVAVLDVEVPASV